MIKHVAAALSLALLTACAGPVIDTDADPAVQFSQYHTYVWQQTPTDAPPLVKQRIVHAIDAALQAKGWQRQDAGREADIGLAAHVATEQRQTLDTFYSDPGWNAWGWHGGWGMARTTVNTYDVGTLVVDMFDLKSQRAVWRGTVSGALPGSSEKLNQGLQEGIAKLFDAFPPDSPAK
ncbi:DUF4136 domain-containing protein [Castellaniella hirudinis]|uniref:DUF4136 domain-containing protein n=1 Tax=Castellaniella hirudinis TaxID=1144617 RepID=UPI0039C25F71